MDARYTTFLTLCRQMNYRRSAQELHLTQPAVTRQIQSLEAELGTRLFIYDHRTLRRTPASRILENYILSLQHNYDLLRADLRRQQVRKIRIGATKTVGDFVIVDAVEQYLDDPLHSLCLEVDNTEALLKRLRQSQLDFAVIEGVFDKRSYNSRLLRLEPFSGICGAGHPFAGKTVSLEELTDETVIVREQGSGTRNLLERELADRGWSLRMFRRCCEISSFALIRRLVRVGIGVSFTYEAVAKDDPDIAAFQVEGFAARHEFNVVWLKNTQIPAEGEQFLQLLKEGTGGTQE